MTRLSVTATVLVLGAVTGLSGCTDDGVSKAGGSAPPVTLTIGTDDPEGRLTGTVIEEFARRVAEASDGTVVIEPKWRAAGADAADWDQRVGRMVTSGELDMGLIPARSWDTEGVTTLKALHAPFLVDSDALVDAVVTSAVADEMLAGLEQAGVTGLALVPESLRHPFSFAEPVMGPGDLVGRAVRAPRSDVSYSVLAAFGAEPTDAAGPGEDFGASVADGSITVVESSFDGAHSLPQPAVGTANVTFYPKVETIVVNSKVLAGLDDQQRAALKKAAVDTRTWAIDELPTEAQVVQDFCAAGLQSVLAPADSLEEWEAASRPVYDELEKDAATARMIATITALKESVTVAEAARPVACGVNAPTATPLVAPSGAANVIPNGTYRRENTLEALVAAGLDEAVARDYAEVLTFTLDDGVYRETPPADATYEACVGSYSSTASQLELRFETNCSGILSATWMVDEEGLHLSDLSDSSNPAAPEVGPEAIFGGPAFTKIG